MRFRLRVVSIRDCLLGLVAPIAEPADDGLADPAGPRQVGAEVPDRRIVRPVAADKMEVLAVVPGKDHHRPLGQGERGPLRGVRGPTTHDLRNLGRQLENPGVLNLQPVVSEQPPRLATHDAEEPPVGRGSLTPYLASSLPIWASVQPTSSWIAATPDRCIRASSLSNGSTAIHAPSRAQRTSSSAVGDE
jgi:hypothetical protein